MKKAFKVIVMGIAVLFLLSGVSIAATYEYNDMYANWPGWEISASDEIGMPHVDGMTVITDGQDAYLSQVLIHFRADSSRIQPEYLFINAFYDGGKYDAWDYGVKNGWSSGTFYIIDEDYAYGYATTGRTGHPSSIEQGATQADGYLASVTYGSKTLTYNFVDQMIAVGSEGKFVIGWAPISCANDVLLTPVPEPGLLLLLGLGLVGIVTLKRKVS
jgi:hypothetical protein